MHGVKHDIPADTPHAQILQTRHLQLAVMALLAVAAGIVVIQYSDLDLWLADVYYDAAQGGFPWNRTWFARDLMHGYVKNVIVWFGFLLIGTVIFDLFLPIAAIPPLLRVQLRFVALASLLEPSLVGSLKASSSLQCPFGVDVYGGSQPLLRVFDAVPEGWRDGHCFPAGHASAGMWLSALGVFCLPAKPHKALALFLAGLAIGLFMGWVQQMRGMHFLSHTLATAWVSTALLTTMLLAFRRSLHSAAQGADAARAGLFAWSRA